MSPLPTPLGIVASGPALSSQFIVSGLGSGYGAAVTSLEGNSYVQSYGTLYKLTKKGKTQWARQLASAGNRYAVDVDSSENAYTAGSNSSVAKYDSSGNLQWQRTVGSGINWQVCKEYGGSLYVAGYDSTYGYFAQINGSTGALTAARRTNSKVEFYGIDVNATTIALTANNTPNSGTSYDAIYFHVNSSNLSITYQKRMSLGTSINIFPQSVALDSSSFPAISGQIASPQTSFIVRFNTSGTVQSSLRSASTSSGYIQNSGGTVAYDASGYLYLSTYSLYNNYTPNDWGVTYTRFSGSTPQKTVAFGNTSGALRIAASKIDNTIALMGVNQFIKVNGLTNVAAGAYKTFTIRDNPTDYSFVSSGISISDSGFSFSDPGISSTASSYSSVSASVTPTVTYLK